MRRKVCTKCDKILPIGQFYALPSGNHHGKCKKCFAVSSREYFLSHKEEIYYRLRQKREKIQSKIKSLIVSLKNSTPCFDCHRKYPYYVMDMDHARGKKEFEISAQLRNVNTEASANRFMEEIKKCDVVCVNCHRERTYQRQYGK